MLNNQTWYMWKFSIW